MQLVDVMQPGGAEVNIDQSSNFVEFEFLKGYFLIRVSNYHI